MHPNASQQVRMDPNGSRHVRKLRTPRENLEKRRENFEKLRENVYKNFFHGAVQHHHSHSHGSGCGRSGSSSGTEAMPLLWLWLWLAVAATMAVALKPLQLIPICTPGFVCFLHPKLFRNPVSK